MGTLQDEVPPAEEEFWVAPQRQKQTTPLEPDFPTTHATDATDARR